MATTDKKYLDLTGLQHLLNKLNSENRIVKHATNKTKTEGAYKIAVDANGHVTAGAALAVGDISNAAAKSDIKNATITLSINGVEKTFTTNQATASKLAWTLNDLGLTNALHFKGVKTSLPAAADYVEGDVVLVGNKEYVLALNGENGAKKWNELGDAESHALKSITISGDGTFITGGGTLADNRTLSHKLYNGAATKGAYKIAIDNAGHVSESEALTIANNGSHTHTTKVTIPASTYIGTVTPTTKKLSISKKADTAKTETVVKSYPGSSSKLVTTSVTGVSTNTTTASKATAQTAKDVAKAGTAVTVATRAASTTVVGNANRATAATTVMTGLGGTAYSATYSADDECLTLSALIPTTKGIYEATASETTIYGCGDNTSVTPAVANGSITPYTFADVTVPIKATATTVATGALAATGTGGAVLTGLGTATTATVIKTESDYSAVLGTSGDVDVVSSVSSSQVAAKEITATVENAGSHNHNFN
jgi:hypothetical protein